MRIHLEFNDDEPELAMRAIHGNAAFSALWDMDAMLRHFLKHGDLSLIHISEPTRPY